MADRARRSADSHAGACCTADPRIARHFDEIILEQTDEADGDFPQMVDVSTTLLRLLAPDVDSQAPSVLELGCGSGALTVALVKGGAARARGVDVSPGMLAAAVRRAEAAGVEDRVAFRVGDGALETLEAADWVVLDRVICCYPEMTRLLANALAAARSRVAFTVPLSRGWRGMINRVLWRAENLPLLIGRPGCPTYVHSLDRIETELARAGFLPVRSERIGLWHAAVWDRATA